MNYVLWGAILATVVITIWFVIRLLPHVLFYFALAFIFMQLFLFTEETSPETPESTKVNTKSGS